MGIESGNKNVNGADTTERTYADLYDDELHAPSIAAAEQALEPSAETVDTSFADLAGSVEISPAAPLSPERREEVLEQIEHEEGRLGTNLQTHAEVVSAAEARLDASAPEASASKKLLTYAQVGELYKKANDRVNKMFYGGMIGAGALMATGAAIGAFEGGPQDPFMGPDAAQKAQHILEIGKHALESGSLVLVGTVAAIAIAKTMNWLRKRSGEKASFNPRTA
ncbi:MAG: hypothetical protein JWL75_61 [Parcubacteria group bacterium]|nr:hypothetical protein [Parcubacteria group bacterium]